MDFDNKDTAWLEGTDLVLYKLPKETIPYMTGQRSIHNYFVPNKSKVDLTGDRFLTIRGVPTREYERPVVLNLSTPYLATTDLTTHGGMIHKDIIAVDVSSRGGYCGAMLLAGPDPKICGIQFSGTDSRAEFQPIDFVDVRNLILALDPKYICRQTTEVEDVQVLTDQLSDAEFQATDDAVYELKAPLVFPRAAPPFAVPQFLPQNNVVVPNLRPQRQLYCSPAMSMAFFGILLCMYLAKSVPIISPGLSHILELSVNMFWVLCWIITVLVHVLQPQLLMGLPGWSLALIHLQVLVDISNLANGFLAPVRHMWPGTVTFLNQPLFSSICRGTYYGRLITCLILAASSKTSGFRLQKSGMVGLAWLLLLSFLCSSLYAISVCHLLPISSSISIVPECSLVSTLLGKTGTLLLST